MVVDFKTTSVKAERANVWHKSVSERHLKLMEQASHLVVLGDHDDGGGPDDCSYRGLDNMGATDHVNCIVQTLFMTPEFRLGLYDWDGPGSRGDGHEDDDDDEAACVPLQLQRLFARLQFGRGYRSISAKDLIASFGWNAGQAYNPSHDLMEMWHLVLDSVEDACSTEGARVSCAPL
jgi:hypothetical protein